MRRQTGSLFCFILAVLIVGPTTLSVGHAQFTTRVSVGGGPNNASFDPVLSADGRYVAFESWASNLVPGDGNDTGDIFVYDRQAAITSRVSVDLQGGDPDQPSSTPSISADGRFVAFTSLATNLVSGDGNKKSDIFVYDRHTGTTTRVSIDVQGGDPNDESFQPAISADGRYVAFMSLAGNLVEGDENGTSDIFIYDRQPETTARVSVDRHGRDPNWGSETPAVSADGQFVALHPWRVI